MNITPKLRDAIERYRQGAGEAFTDIYNESKNYIYNCIYKIVCTHNNAADEAAEILNDTYLEISKNLHRLQDVEKFFSWAGTIATRKCFDYIKQHKYYEAETDLSEDYPDDDNIIPETIMQNREKQWMIKQIIDTKLSEMEKLCIVAFYYHEIKQSEIAALLNIPENTVKSNLFRAKKKIRDAVLETEEKQGVKLYGLLPFAGILLGLEMQAMTVQAAEAGAALSAGSAANAGYMGNAGSAGNAVTPEKIGGIAMKTKVIIASVAGVAVAAIITIVAVVIGTSGKGKQKEAEDTQIASVQESSEYNYDDYDDTDYSDYDDYDYDDYDDYDEEERMYLERAGAFKENMDTLLNALKNGDVDTVLSYCLDKSDFKHDVERMKDKETASKILKLVYGDMEWTYEEECLDNIASSLSVSDEGDDLVIGCMCSYHPQIYMRYYYFATLPDGTVLPEDYDGGSEEQAEKIAKTMVSQTPLFVEDGIMVKEISADGTFKIDIDGLFGHEDIHWDKFHSTQSDQVYRAFVRERLDLGSETEFGTKSVFLTDGDKYEKAIELIKSKDWKKLEEFYVQETGQAIPGDISYSDLTPEQQKAVDDYLTNEVEIYHDKESSWTTFEDQRLNQKWGAVMITFPVKYNNLSFYGYAPDFIESHDFKDMIIIFENTYTINRDAKPFNAETFLYEIIRRYASILKTYSEE